MRFPFTATFRIIPISPLSDIDTQDRSDTKAFFDRRFSYPCHANATSGTFDPDIQFNGDDLTSGVFGQFIDVWLSNPIHKSFINLINESGISFSAPLMLRLVDITKVKPNGLAEPVTLFDPTLDSFRDRGFPLAGTRSYPTMTAFTFEVKRIGL